MALLLTKTHGQSKKYYGYINETGSVVIEPKYEGAGDFHEGLAIVTLNGKWGAINKKGEIIIPFEYDFIGNFSHGLANASKDKKYGYLNTSGQVAIPFIYDYSMPMSSKGFAFVLKTRSSDSWGVIDHSGKQVIPLSFQSLLFNPDLNLIPAKKNSAWGFIDKRGNIVIPCIYDTVSFFYSNGLAQVTLNKKKGFINTSGKIITPIIYDNFVVPFKKSGMWGYAGEDWYYITPEGKPVAAGKNVYPNSFDDGFCKVILNYTEGMVMNTDDGCYYISVDGKKTIPPEGKSEPFKGGGFFSDGMVSVYDEEDADGDPKWYYIDSFGSRINDQTYKDAHKFSNGIAWVSNTIKPSVFISRIRDYTDYYAINKEGRIVIPGKYPYAYDFEGDDVVPVQKDKKHGLIDRTGKMVVPLIYEDLGLIRHGIAYFKQNGKYGYINARGNIIVPAKYKDKAFIPLKIGIFPVSIELSKSFSKQVWGLIDSTGREITPFKYDKIETISENGENGLIMVELNEKRGFVNTMGKEIVPPEFYSVFYNKDQKVIETFKKDEQKRELRGFYSLDGTEIAPCRYFSTTTFKDNVAYGLYNNQYWVIHRSGKQVALPKEYKYFEFNDGMAKIVIEK